MELNITKLVERFEDSMESLSSSIADSGLENIGQVTWRNACEAMADESDWLTSDLGALLDYFACFGAWEREELESMSGAELNALLAQFISGDFQGRRDAEERGELERWEECEGGPLFRSDDGEWFYYVGG